jgi:hypothetical protein
VPSLSHAKFDRGGLTTLRHDPRQQFQYLKRVVGVNNGLVELRRRDHCGRVIAILGLIVRDIDQWQGRVAAQAEENCRASLDDRVRVLQLLDVALTDDRAPEQVG